MIKCDGKTCCVSGIGIKIRSEFSTVVHATFTAMVESGVPSGLAKEMLKRDFEDGLKSKDELKKESEEMMEEIRKKPPEEISKRIDELIDLIFGGAADGSD